ncbi:MAG: hypothetical protein NZM05_12525, partial [Chloroherpetonaceae bacterium]|nr:hypothetical protein [Chloroherpetonaceae bacterium]
EATGDIENSPNAKEDGKENKNDIINNIIPLLQTGNEDNNENENENEENKINEKENDEYKENEDNNENENEENKINEKENDEDNNKNDINGEDWGIKNSRQAFSLDNRYTINRLKAVFAAVIGKVAEDLSYEITEGDDEWDMNALLMRRYSGRSIFSCRQSRKKERVVIALDTSGSCMKQADFFANIAEIALQLGDVELYDAPNGETFSYNNGQGWQSFFDHQSRIIPWHMLRGRHIIFFGDFDAAVFVVDASMKNKVYWFSCETRYETSSEYGWFLGSGQGKFKGKYFRCVDEEDFIKLSKKIK